MVVGIAVDKSASANLTSKKDLKVLLPDEQVRELARDSLVAEWEQGVRITEEDKDVGLSDSRGDAIDMSVDLASFHGRSVAPLIQPTHVQRLWTLDIEGMPLQLAGTIDIQEGLKSILDTKTSGKSPVKTLADTSLQLTTYALAVLAHDGALPETVGLDYCVRTPKKHECKYVPLRSKRTTEDMAPLLARIAQAERAIRSGIFTPAPADAWWCSSRWCPYHDGQCKYAVRPVSVAVQSE
jgi:hypothetical protein